MIKNTAQCVQCEKFLMQNAFSAKLPKAKTLTIEKSYGEKY